MGNSSSAPRTRAELVYCRARHTGFEDRIYVMYHGTDSSNVHSILRHGFRVSQDGMLGKGIYVSEDIDKTKAYGDVTLKLVVYVGKTIKITTQSQSNRKTWQQEGNSAWVPSGCGMVGSGRSENCVRTKKQVRVLGVVRGWDQLDSKTKALTRNRTGTTTPLDNKERREMDDLKREYGLR